MTLAESIATREAFSLERGQISWDSTSITEYQTCPRKYFYTILMGYRPRMGDSPHLVFGDHCARALKMFFDLIAKGRDRESALHDVVKEALLQTKDWHSDHPSKNRFSLIRTIVWYIDHYEDDTMEVAVSHDGKPLAEISFLIDLDTFILAGTFDQVVKIDDTFYVRDQKTSTSELRDRWFREWDLNNQMTAYTLAGKTETGIPVSGVVIDGIQVGAGYTRFQRGFTFRTQGQIEEWIHETKHLVSRGQLDYRLAMKALDGPEKYFSRNLSSCTKYGGCQFANVCRKDPHVRRQFLKADFKQVMWDPQTATATEVSE